MNVLWSDNIKSTILRVKGFRSRIFIFKRLEFAFGWSIDFENNSRNFRSHFIVDSNVFIEVFECFDDFCRREVVFDAIS